MAQRRIRSAAGQLSLFTTLPLWRTLRRPPRKPHSGPLRLSRRPTQPGSRPHRPTAVQQANSNRPHSNRSNRPDHTGSAGYFLFITTPIPLPFKGSKSDDN